MNTSEQFCLKWNDFKENISMAFGSLKEDTDLTDVTLACEDGQQVEAHKVILAMSSPVFQNIFKRNKHTHPLIYMRGMKSKDLMAVIDFVYHGETNIYQDNLDSFLAIAEELELKGLAQGTPQTQEVGYSKPIHQKINLVKEESKQEKLGTESLNLDIIENEPVNGPENTVALNDFKVSVEVQQLDEQIKCLMKLGENMLTGSNSNKRSTICTVCGKEGLWANIRTHIEANHIEGISHPCNSCGKIFRSRPSLRTHKSSFHKQ